MDRFRKDLENLINQHSKENGSNTPDFLLAQYLCDCLKAFDQAVNNREHFYSRPMPEQEQEVIPLNSEAKGIEMSENKQTKRITVGDWVRVEGEPGTRGSYIGEVKAITDEKELIIQSDMNANIENFAYCTVIAHRYNKQISGEVGGHLSVEPGPDIHIT